jgi:type I restriction enzyme S subunit
MIQIDFMKSECNNLLQGWCVTSLGEIATYVNGRAFKPSEWVSSGKPIIRIQNLNDRDAKFNYSDVQHEDKYLVSNSDLLFAWSASLGAYIWNGQDAWLNQHIFKVHPSICVDKKFLYYLLTNVTAGLYAKAHGSGMVHVTKGKFEATEVFLPPLSEQHRIVAKIETLFSELDKGIESFKTAREQLKIYRQSLLKHAFSGKLTEQWRAENPDKLESAQALLQRIETERQQRYQQQLKNWEANDKQGSKPKALKTLPPLTTEELAELPEGWAWCRLGSTNVDVSDGPFGSNLKSSDYVDNGVRVIRLENIGALKFIEDKESYVTDAKYELLKNHTVSSGDIVFSSFITENVRVALVPQSITKAINKADCFCIRLYGETLSNGYTVMFLSIRWVFKQLEAQIHGVGRPRINTTQLKDLPVPVCNSEEQKVIIEKLESCLSEVDQLDQTITTALQQAEALRQSILKKAFSGQLVPQDPSDEPASVLLERIRVEKAQADIQPVRRRGKTS